MCKIIYGKFDPGPFHLGQVQLSDQLVRSRLDGFRQCHIRLPGLHAGHCCQCECSFPTLDSFRLMVIDELALSLTWCHLYLCCGLLVPMGLMSVYRIPSERKIGRGHGAEDV
jgi:hypothetical protein